MKKNLWKLILPVAFQQFMLALVSASDALMPGRLNQDSPSAVSLASQVTFVFQLFMAALVIGTGMFAVLATVLANAAGSSVPAEIPALGCSAMRLLCGALPFPWV